MQSAYENNSPPLTTYKVHSNTIPDMVETIDLENGLNPIIEITDYFREWYGEKVRVNVSLTHSTVNVEYDF